MRHSLALFMILTACTWVMWEKKIFLPPSGQLVTASTHWAAMMTSESLEECRSLISPALESRRTMFEKVEGLKPTILNGSLFVVPDRRLPPNFDSVVYKFECWQENLDPRK